MVEPITPAIATALNSSSKSVSADTPKIISISGNKEIKVVTPRAPMRIIPPLA